MNRKLRIPSSGIRKESSRDSRSSIPSLSSRSSVPGGRSSITSSSSKLPRSTPLMHSTKKVLPSTAQKPLKRSSYFGASEHHVMKDTRPISDKGYMKKCVLELLAFLTDKNYPHPLTVKMLMPPTNKEYYRMIEFVFQIMSPSYNMVARPEEETAKILFDLSYPFNFSKSTLSNIGTMSAWPHALAALHWLMELGKYYLAVQENEVDQMLYRSQKKEELKLNYLSETYSAFMHGENEPYIDINTNYTALVESLSKDQLDEIEDLKVKERNLKMRRDEMRKVKTDISDMEERLASMQQDKKYFHSYFDQFEEYCKSLKNKCSLLEANYEEIVKIYVSLKNEVKELQCTVKGQELSVADVQKLQIEISQVEKTVKTLETRNKELEEEYWEKQIQLSKRIDKIDPQIVKYTEKCRRIQIIPENAEHADGVDYSLKSDYAEIEKSEEKLVSVIRPKLMSLKSEYIAQNGKLQRANNHATTKLDQYKEQVQDQVRLKASLEEQAEKLRIEFEKQMAEHTKEEDFNGEEIQRLKEEIESYKTVNSVSIADVLAQKKAETDKLRESELKWTKEEDEMQDFLLRLTTKCLEQKERIHKMFEGLSKFMAQQKESYALAMKDLENKMLALQERSEKVKVRTAELSRQSDSLSDQENEDPGKKIA